MGSACGITKKRTDPTTLPTSWNVHPQPSASTSESASVPLSSHLITTSSASLKKLAKWNSLFGSRVVGKNRLRLHPVLSRYLKQGPPPHYRWPGWLIVLGLQHKCCSEEIAEQPSVEVVQDIEKDLSRTFPTHPYFQESGQAALRRVLWKFACAHPEIGYCQGMNFVAGFLLLVSGGQEVETYEVFATVLHKFSLLEYFSESMNGVRSALTTFSNLFAKSCSKLHRHFQEESFTEDSWLLKWLMSLFTIAFKLEDVMRVWDFFVVEGSSFLFRVALALLKSYQSSLLVKDLGGLHEFFASLSTVDIETLLKDAQKISVSIKNTHEPQQRTHTSIPKLAPATARPTVIHRKSIKLPTILKLAQSGREPRLSKQFSLPQLQKRRPMLSTLEVPQLEQASMNSSVQSILADSRRHSRRTATLLVRRSGY